MKNIPDKSPGDNYTADDFNTGINQELRNVVVDSGQVQTEADQKQIIRAIVNLTHPIGAGFLDLTGTLTPPAQGIAGITWVEQTAAEGHILMGANASGDWQVAAGATAGTLQKADDHTLVFNNLPDAVSGKPLNYIQGGNGTSADSIFGSPNGAEQPLVPTTTAVVVNLTGLQRFGVKIWKRTA